jgi:hypothetical protein
VVAQIEAYRLTWPQIDGGIGRANRDRTDVMRVPRMHPRVSSRIVPCRFIRRFTRDIDLIPSRGHFRDEKVRGSSPLSSTHVMSRDIVQI